MIDRKKEHNNTVAEINSMIKRVRNLNESLSFENLDNDIQDEPSDDDFDFSDDKEEKAEMPSKEMETNIDDEELSDIDRIREIALKGMVRLIKQSNTSEYETLKKIFQFCDRANNEKEDEMDNNRK